MSKKYKTRATGLTHKGSKFDLFRPLTLLVIITSVAIAPFTFDAFTLPKIFFLYLGLMVVGFMPLVKGKKHIAFNQLPSWFISIICILLILVTISAHVSQTPLLRALFGQFGRGNGLFYYFGALAVLLLAAISYSKENENQFTKAMTYLSIAFGAYAILQSVGIDIADLDLKGLSPVVLTFGNSNFAGGFLAMLFGFIFTRSFRSKELDLKDLVLSIFLLFGVYKTGAVQGYLIVLSVILIIVPLRLVSFARNKIWKFTLYFSWGAVTSLLFLGAASIGPLSNVFERPSFQMRIEYWKIGIKILRDNLILGIGPDRMYDVSPLYMNPGSLKVITATSLDSPHNWFIHFGSSFGLPALLLLLILLIVPIIVFLKRSKFENFLSSPVAPTLMALICLLIDALVSVEQIGLGIWMYFFAGKVLASFHIESSEKQNHQYLSDRYRKFMLLTLVPILFLVSISSVIILDRFVNDGLLRSFAQKVVTGSQSQIDFKELESLVIKLKAEPEYAVNSVPILAKVGDKQALLRISKSYYDFNPQSRQATSIRFEVLNALTPLNNSCPLLPTLIATTPWESTFVDKYLLCAESGYYGSNQTSLLMLIEEFIDISFPRAKGGELTSPDLLARAVYANLQFQLGMVEVARALRKQLILDISEYANSNPAEDLSRITSVIDF